MYDNYNYPPGSDTPDAPWNQRDIPEMDVTVYVNTNLTRKAIVSTTNYSVERDEGGAEIDLHDGYTELERYYNEQHHGILYLLNELTKYIKRELLSEGVSGSRRQELQSMLEDCQGWDEETSIDDYDY